MACVGLVAQAGCSKTATDRDKDENGVVGWEESYQAMEACLAGKCFDQLAADKFDVPNVVLNGNAKALEAHRCAFPDGTVWRCFSHLGVNFKAQLAKLQVGAVSAVPLFRLVDRVYESPRKGSTTRTLSHMHSFPHFVPPTTFPMFHCVTC